jgi:hypothetical protein
MTVTFEEILEEVLASMNPPKLSKEVFKTSLEDSELVDKILSELTS